MKTFSNTYFFGTFMNDFDPKHKEFTRNNCSRYFRARPNPKLSNKNRIELIKKKTN